MALARTALALVIAGILGWIALVGGAVESMPYRTATAIFVPPAAAEPISAAEGMAGYAAEAGGDGAAAGSPRTYVIAASALRLRDAPSTDAAIVGSYQRGTAVEVTQRNAGWAEVSLPDGRTGWMSDEWLAPDAKG